MNTYYDELDNEWIEMILEAKKIGMNKEDILTFLRQEVEEGPDIEKP
ncbi:DNA-binding anti-repressor SinI [Bacillus massilinigeriensis]|nr:DNA-binding anti-repressor SinI [Bacillus massilionigeriensis]